MTNKMNRVDALNLAIAALSDNAAAVETLTNIRESIAKANARRSDKPTKAQTANEALKAELMQVMADGTDRTVSMMLVDVPAFNGFSNQKVSALVKQLCDAGQLVKDVRQRKAWFKLPD